MLIIKCFISLKDLSKPSQFYSKSFSLFGKRRRVCKASSSAVCVHAQASAEIDGVGFLCCSRTPPVGGEKTPVELLLRNSPVPAALFCVSFMCTIAELQVCGRAFCIWCGVLPRFLSHLCQHIHRF